MQDYLYSVIGFIAIAVQLIINYKVMFISEVNSERKAGKMYRMLMLSVFAYYITDALWGILAGLNWIPLLFADTTVYYIAMSLIIVCFYMYFVDYLEMKDWKGRFFTLFGKAFFILEIICLIINFIKPCDFPECNANGRNESETPSCHFLLQSYHACRHIIPGEIPSVAVLCARLPYRKLRSARLCCGR